MKRHVAAAFAAILVSSAAMAGIPNYDAPFAGATQMTVGATYSTGRGIAEVCTAAGNVTYAMADGTSITVPVAVGYQSYPFAVLSVTASTGTCTHYRLF